MDVIILDSAQDPKESWHECHPHARNLFNAGCPEMIGPMDSGIRRNDEVLFACGFAALVSLNLGTFAVIVGLICPYGLLAALFDLLCCGGVEVFVES